MCESKVAKSEVTHLGEECFIELPKSMRKVGEEDNDEADVNNDRELNIGVPMIKRDAVKEKFNQLRRLDGAPELIDVNCALSIHSSAKSVMVIV